VGLLFEVLKKLFPDYFYVAYFLFSSFMATLLSVKRDSTEARHLLW